MTITKKTIAKDVLKWINNGLNIATGAYVDFEKTTQDMTEAQYQAFEKLDAKTAIKFAPCEVCALGAITLALVDRKNTLKVKDLDKVARKHNHPFLTEHFTKRELLDIEMFFECNNIVEGQDKSKYAFLDYCSDWDFLDADDRAKNIFTYIAKYGEFTPEKFIKWYEGRPEQL